MEAAGDSGMSRAEVLRDAVNAKRSGWLPVQERERFLAGWIGAEDRYAPPQHCQRCCVQRRNQTRWRSR